MPVQSMSDGGLPPNRSQRRVGEAQAMPGAQAHQAEAGRAGGASGVKRKEGAMMPEEVKAKRRAKARENICASAAHESRSSDAGSTENIQAVVSSILQEIMFAVELIEHELQKEESCKTSWTCASSSGTVRLLWKTTARARQLSSAVLASAATAARAKRLGKRKKRRKRFGARAKCPCDALKRPEK